MEGKLNHKQHKNNTTSLIFIPEDTRKGNSNKPSQPINGGRPKLHNFRLPDLAWPSSIPSPVRSTSVSFAPRDIYTRRETMERQSGISQPQKHHSDQPWPSY